jgi:uncharacterized protein YutE (UPF0331/DUF86 family)
MDRDVVLFKIESLERCVDRIRSKVPATPQDLAGNLDAQDIIVLNLERAVQLCVDIAAHVVAELKIPAPMTMADSFARLRQTGVLDEDVTQRMQKAVGFRNIAVREYQAINWDMVHSIITDRLDDFRQYAAAIVGWMETHG